MILLLWYGSKFLDDESSSLDPVYLVFLVSLLLAFPVICLLFNFNVEYGLLRLPLRFIWILGFLGAAPWGSLGLRLGILRVL